MLVRSLGRVTTRVPFACIVHVDEKRERGSSSSDAGKKSHEYAPR